MSDEEERQSNRDQLEAQLEGFGRLGRLMDWGRVTAYPDRLEERIEALAEREGEGILSFEPMRRLDIVLCTGGPHCEVQWFEGSDRLEAVCFGWFGSGEVRRVLSDEEYDGFFRAIGYNDFDEAWEMLVDHHALSR